MTVPGDPPLARMSGISKHFGGISALENVSVDLYPGEVVGILGHNGAGKSTLVKILAGAVTPDAGEIHIGGERVVIRDPNDARAHGIETIYQELALCGNLDAPSNLFMGRETNRYGFLDDKYMLRETRRILDSLRIRIGNLGAPVENLSGGQRQSIAIARAIYFNAKVLIMDEPTAALGQRETRAFKDLVLRLKSAGIGMLVISHDIHDVFDLSDRITVMSNGRQVGTRHTADVTKDQVLGMIILGKLPEEGTEEELAQLH